MIVRVRWCDAVRANDIVIHDPSWIRLALMDTIGSLNQGCFGNPYRGFGFFQTPGQQGLDGIDLVIVNHFEHMGEVGQGVDPV